MRVAIVVVNWNGWQDTIECMSAIVAGDALRIADVWIVDNASSDGSIDRIAHWCEAPAADPAWCRPDGVRHCGAGTVPVRYRRWRANGQPAPLMPGVQVNLVEAGANLGFAGGNNCGIAAAGLNRYSHFWLLNNDAVMASDALSHLIEHASASPRTGMTGSTLCYYHDPTKVQALGGGSFDRATMRMSHVGESLSVDRIPSGFAEIEAIEARMSYVVGASMLVSTSFVRDVGTMQEDYFLYLEELDWAFRGRPRYALGYAVRSRVYHKAGASTRRRSEFSLGLLYRNQVKFASRFMPERLPALRRKFVLEWVKHLIRWQLVEAKVVGRTLREFHAIAGSVSAVTQRLTG